jgi:hypothetical protein
MKGIYRVLKKNFCEWKPKMPKNKIVIDTKTYRAPHPIWNMKDAEKVEITHVPPKTLKDNFAWFLVRILRLGFDLFSGYQKGKMTENLYIRRCLFLETIAGVPGMVGGMMRHLAALRYLREDGGWIHHLMEEAENERMHLLTFLKVRQPGILMRLFILWSQLIFYLSYQSLYLISSTAAHRFVGYLEEEAVKTYTGLIEEIDEGRLPRLAKQEPPKEAIKYWGLPENATFRDIVVAIRADETFHREFNHHLADIPKDTPIEGHKYVLGDEIKWETEEENRIGKEKQKSNKM